MKELTSMKFACCSGKHYDTGNCRSLRDLARIVVLVIFVAIMGCGPSFAIEYYEVVSEDPVNVREKPSTASSVVDVVIEGEEVMLLTENPEGDWLFVKLENGNHGYVYHEYLKLVRTEPDPEMPEENLVENQIFLKEHKLFGVKDTGFKGVWDIFGIIALVIAIVIAIVIYVSIDDMDAKLVTVLVCVAELLAAGGAFALFAGIESFWNGFIGYFLGIIVLMLPFAVLLFTTDSFLHLTAARCNLEVGPLRGIVYVGSGITALFAAVCTAFNWSFGNTIAQIYMVVLGLGTLYILYKGITSRQYLYAIVAAAIYFISGMLMMLSMSIYFCVSLLCIILLIVLAFVFSPGSGDRGFLKDVYNNKVWGTFYSGDRFHGDNGIVYRQKKDGKWHPD